MIVQPASPDATHLAEGRESPTHIQVPASFRYSSQDTNEFAADFTDAKDVSLGLIGQQHNPGINCNQGAPTQSSTWRLHPGWGAERASVGFHCVQRSSLGATTLSKESSSSTSGRAICTAASRRVCALRCCVSTVCVWRQRRSVRGPSTCNTPAQPSSAGQPSSCWA